MSHLYPIKGSHGSILNRGRRGSDLYFQDYSMMTTMEEEKQLEKRLEENRKRVNSGCLQVVENCFVSSYSRMLFFQGSNKVSVA